MQALFSRTAAALLLGACSAAPAPTRAPSHVVIFRVGETPPPQLIRLGSVQGYACNSGSIDPAAARARATDQATYRAVLLGADAITAFSCAVVETEETCTDCWICAQCEGTAAKLNSG